MLHVYCCIIVFFFFHDVSLQDADKSEIRKQYRELSKKFHPDKETGDQDMFMKIAKAYEA